MFWRKQNFNSSKHGVMSKQIKRIPTNGLDIPKGGLVKAMLRQSIDDRLEAISAGLNFSNSDPDARQQMN